MFPTNIYFEKYDKKKIGHRAYFWDIMGQFNPIYSCTGTNQNYDKILELDSF